MKILWQLMNAHPVATALIAATWISAQVFVIVTWIRDAAGQPQGMNEAAFWVQPLAVLVAGAIVGAVGHAEPAAGPVIRRRRH